MPVPASEKQIRYAFAAEGRGEMPKGTGERWARERKNYCKKHRRSGDCKACHAVSGGKLICR